jgi:hypothetical protein
LLVAVPFQSPKACSAKHSGYLDAGFCSVSAAKADGIS